MIVGGNIAGVTRVMTTSSPWKRARETLRSPWRWGWCCWPVVGALNLAVGLVQVQRPPRRRWRAGRCPRPAGRRARPRRRHSVTLRGAGVRFGAVRALSDVSLEVRRGERIALVGANGSGKTHPAAAAARHAWRRPRARARLRRHRPARWAPARDAPGRWAPCCSSALFLLHLSAQANVRVALWLAACPGPSTPGARRRRWRGWGCSPRRRAPRASSPAGSSSGWPWPAPGPRARACCFLDEPTASLDPGAKHEVEALIEAFADEGPTVVLSTHNLGAGQAPGAARAVPGRRAPARGPARAALLRPSRCPRPPRSSSRESCHGDAPAARGLRAGAGPCWRPRWSC
jgi:tungstate transport system ATP-binding protein